MPETELFGIAIIGLAGRFPQSTDLAAFWDMLKNGREGITIFSDDELLATGVDAGLLQHPDYVKTGSVVPKIEYFDANFFDMSARDAEITDPQQRLFMECVWQALEQAGYPPATTEARIGVYAGVGENNYQRYCLEPNPNLLASVGAYRVFTLSGKDFIATRTAYKLNLTGPAMSVQTACSTSLVAVHVACQSLLNFECDLVLAGGASINIPQTQGYLYQKDMIMSPDGHCRTFDARAQGTAAGSGVGVVLLKRLDEAISDGDTIYAVIRGSAVNNDGADKIGYTAPSVRGQTDVILEAQATADVHPDDISYIEAHGTATPLGDPIEIQALTQAFRTKTERTNYCAIGSVKSNIGHADTAAGIAGLIKTVLALKHRQLPPSLHFEQPNPQIDFANSPFFVNTQLRDWETVGNTPRCAGISSFGVGGTNAHVIVTEAPTLEPSGTSRPLQLLTLSAKTSTALEATTRNLASWLQQHPAELLPDIAYTLNRGRQSFAWRRTVVGSDTEEVRQQLETLAYSPAYQVPEKAAEVAFLFPGQGSQYPQMTQGLYETEPLFRETLDHCAELLSPHLRLDLRAVLYSDDERSAEQLKQTRFTQPALFTVEYALAKLWMAWGIQPKAMLGHSIGEYVAACLAGVFSLEDGLALIAARGQLIQSLPPSAMLAVPLSEPAMQSWLSPALSLSVINGENRCVIGGIPEIIANLQKSLHNQGIEGRHLHTSHAFHSHLMEPILTEFAQKIEKIKLNPPVIPYLSNLTGTWIRPEQATNPDYWVRHLRHTVRFADNVQALLQQKATVLLEIGPGRTLSSLIQQHADYSPQFNLLHSLPKQRKTADNAEIRQLLTTLGNVWSSGVTVDWDAFYVDEKRHRVPLPTYPFERRKYWIDPPARDGIVPKNDTQMPIAKQGLTQLSENVGNLFDTLPASTDLTASPRPVSAKPYVAPCTPTEMQLAEIWQAFLGIAPIGIEDDFFELGGDSLLATQLAARIRDGLNINMPLQVLFENPMLGDLATWLEKQQGGGTLSPIKPQVADEPLILSYAQQRLWFLAQLEGPSATYNLPAALEIIGLLDVWSLENTFVTLVQRHQTLRICFYEVNNEARLREIPAYNPLVVTDLSHLSANEQDAQVQRLAKEHAAEPFDLATGPLLRLHLLILGDERSVLLFNMHHIISDGWSINILIREWVEIYTALSQGKTPALEPLAIQYSDYAAWQKSWLQGEVLQRQLDYWTKQLNGAPGVLELPGDYPRPAVQSHRGAHWQSQLSPELTYQLKQLSQQQGATLFMILLAAFNILLYRYSGQDDILVGSPIANRTQSQTENLIGFFVNTLVLRTQIPARISFTELLKHTKQSALGAYAHQDIPFEHLVDQLKPERSLNHSPLFQVMFVLQNNAQSDLSLPGLDIRELELENPVAKFDLNLSAFEVEDHIKIRWEYATDLFQSWRIERMAEHLAILLEGIVRNPEADIHGILLLTETETRQLIQWNQTEVDYPRDKTIVNLFEEQVEKAPDNIAVVFEDQQLTYAELNQQANRVAHYLRTLFTTDHCLIAICTERSPDMVFGLLGIFKAGGAYIPLDPDYPLERLRFMLKDSQASALLTQRCLQEKLSELETQMVYLDEVETFQAQPASNPKYYSQPDDLAYVIYTSGSTGKPKGVMIQNSALCNYLLHIRQHFAEGGRFAWSSTVAADLGNTILFGALCSGGSLYVIDRQCALDSHCYNSAVEQYGIEYLKITPSHLIALQTPETPVMPARMLIVGGEASSTEWIGKLHQQYPDCHILNHYGPSEATIGCVTYSVNEGIDNHQYASLPIGKPISNTRIHILDTNHQPQPIGIPGELCIAGAGLALGYLNRPELTAEKFIELKLFGEKQRVYKTGDLARWLADGNLEFLGRIDYQIKLRGFRIELGEIEAVLTQHNAVKEAVVVLHEIENNKALAAYITTHDDNFTTDNTQLIINVRAWLKDTLPDYMVPAHFMVLDKLPLNPNGKIDRNALPQPEALETLETVAPRSETESLLASLWSAVLNNEVNSISADFFELGGHSLLATQLVSRIRDSFGIDMPLRTLFEHPVLGDLAAWLDQQQCGASLPPIEAQLAGTPLVLSYAQHRLWFLAQLEGPSATYNVQAMLELNGSLNIPALEAAFAALVQRHQSLRLCFPTVNGEATVQEIPTYNPLIVSDLNHLSADGQHTEVQRLAKEHAIEPFDIETGPLLRIHLLILRDRQWVLLFNMHHIISDGWSRGILIREWFDLYQTFSQGQPSKLEPLAIQYPDYAAWQKSWLQGEVLQQQLDYWRAQLSGAPELLELPTDYPRPAMQSYRGAEVRSQLTPELTYQLKQLSQQQNATLFMTLLAAFNVLLHRYSGQDDILIGSPIANRTHSQTEHLIGFFVNTLVLRTRIPACFSFTELLKHTRQTALGAYAHQDIPFDYLVEQLNPERSLSYSPLFQVMFVLQNNAHSDLSLPELNIYRVEPESPVAKFDLTLSVVEFEDCIGVGWEYATDLFQAERIQRMAEHFAILLQGIVDNPGADVHSLPLLTEAETLQLIRWNQTETDYPKEKTLVNLFEEQVAKTPDNIAVVFEDRQLTYTHLNQKANRLAHYLRTLIDRDNCLIGICVERSLEMVIGLLGILKAGGAYVPLDPDYPQERLSYMLEDSQVPLLLTQSNLKKRLPVTDAGIVCLDAPEIFDKQPGDNLTLVSKPEDLAYVLFTSGSTGRPKGVMIEHRNATALLAWSMTTFKPYYFQGTLASTSLNFDLSVFELFVPFCSGGKVILAKNALYLPELTCKQEVKLINTVPSAISELIRTHTIPESVQVVCLAGEPLKRQIVDALYELPHIEAVYNLYGPSEDTTYSTYLLVKREIGTEPNIGSPISNTRIYILDTNYQRQPIGIPGELCISGAGLARGYLNRPELTAEKFLELELSDEKQRVYKTGDLARWLPDGNLEYLGRMDHQIKLRGFRIELGEIEAVLTRHKAVKESVVVLHQREDIKVLAAYITTRNAEFITHSSRFIADLRAWIKEVLPDYMVPAHFMVLEKLPLTPNGKIDRKALPDPEMATNHLDYEAPRNTTEQQLVEIWSAVLKRPDISVHDNFFDLGGDSILSIQIVARARQAGMGLSPRDMFAHQTPAELAHAVQLLSTIDAEQGLVQGEAPLTPIQTWFFSRDNAEPWHFNQAILLEVPADTDETSLQQALAALLAHHDALRLRYHREYGEWRQSYVAQEEVVPFHVETLSCSNLAAALEERACYWQASLNLEHGPLTRMVLFHHAQGTRLLWVIHHLAVDGVSWRILLEDLYAAYTQAYAGETLQLPTKTSSFKAWSERLLQWRNSPEFAAETEYWRQLPRPIVGLPVDNLGGSNRVADACDYTLTLDEATTRSLLEQAPAAYRTGINDLLICALLLALHDWNGQNRYVIDLETHGRADLFENIDLSRTVGWFTALYSVVLELPEPHDIGVILKSVKEQLRKIPHNGIGYGLLRQQGEDLTQGQIVFNYLGQFDLSDQREGFTLAQEGIGRSQSPTSTRGYLININGLTVHKQVSLTFTYGGEQYQAATIRTLAEGYRQHLDRLINHCLDHYGYTPSDFPLATLNQDQLDALVQPYGNNIAAVYPLSPMQQGMLFHSLYAPDSGLYFEQFDLLLSDVDPAILYQSWQWLVDRHPVLRTAFSYDQNNPLQIVLKQVKLPWTEEDWQYLDEENRMKKREILLKHERQQGFDFSRAPLMRLHLIRESANSYRLLWHHHHILMDGWSLPVLFTELFTVYTAMRQGKSPTLPPVNRYQTYIAWLMWQDHEAAQSYWQQKLAGFAAPTPIPIALHGQQNTVYHEAQLTLSLEQTQELNQFARGQRVTLNTLLQSTWAILLGRYSGESDIVFGATVSGRNVPISGIEQMVGLFINTLPLRANLSQDIKTLLHAMQNQQQQDNRYAYSNLANIQNWSEVPNGVALFDSIIVFENYPVDDALQDEQNLPFQINEFHGIEQTNYLLTMAVQPGKTLCFKLGFDHNRIYPQTGERLLEHFQNLLLGIVRNPETDIHSLPLRTETETRQLIQWNQTKSDYPKNKTIVDLFEAQAAKNPDKIAVVFEEQELTYVELNQQANRLSHYLHTLKDTNNGSLITDNCLIAICVERSPEMIVGLLGILKTGGAYVPLDPDYPQERLSYMLDDSRVRVLLTQRHLKNRLPALSAKTLELDTPKVFQQQPLSNPIQRSKADDLAYVIYTSGSTGQPKGVMVTHRNLSNAYFAWHEIYQLDSISSHLQMANFAFDVFTGDWVRALGSGGKLVLCPRNVLTEPDKLFALMEREHIDCAEFVPAVMRGLLEYLQVSRQQLNNMKCCIVGSDLWHYAEYRQLTQCCGKNTKVCNSYGVTECTIDSSYYEAKLSQQIADVTLSVPIGHPFPNTQIHILNVTHQSQPIGIPGELCIAGAGLAHGYLNRPELTAEKFIEIELFGEKQKIYKTGDLARWLPDGNLEYLGRLDHQVKLRGFRIELGEIEAVLTQHETVKEAVVVLHEREGHQVLAAYITMGYSELSIDFRGWLKGKLPDYMIPTHFMVLDKLPLTPNGKINRKALPEPEVRNTTEAIPPRNETESLLANLWSAVLKIEIKSISADFFDLGGHSLLATQLMSRIRDSFSIDMPLRTLFERPVLSDLAAWLDQQQRGITLPPIEPQVTNEPLVLSYAQQRLWFLAQLEGPGATYNIPAALELRGMLDIHALETTFVTLVQRHQSLRLCFPEVNGEATVQEIPAYNPLTVSELNHLSSDDQHVEVQRLAKEHAAASFDLANGPLLWLYLLTLSEQNAVLLFNMHHIISDGWSMDILVREWFDIYSALSQGQTPYLEPLPIQYSDYAAWQRSWLQGEVLQTQIEYWSKQLADAPQTLDLPTDKTRPDQLTYRGAEVSFQIDKTLTQSFKAFSQQQGCTLFMSLLAVYGILLSRYSRQKDILIATPIAGRHHTQLENIIGFFVNNLIIRVRPSNALNFSELLAQVRQTLLEAYAHQDLPFEKLVETLNIPRRQNYSPLSQAAFTMETADFSEPQLPSLHITSLPGISSVAKTDLTLSLVEHEDHLQGVVNYSTDLFIEATAIHFAKDFQALLTLLLEHPQQTLRRTLKNSGIHAQSSVQAGDMTWLLEHSNLTPNQLLIWLGQQVKSNEAVLYQSSLLSHLPFVVSLKHFQSALDTLLNSSDALRSVFLENGGIPRQQVLQALNYQVEWVDLSNGDNPQHALQTWAVRRNAKILTLSEQLFDIALIKLSAEHSIFYLNIHQLIGDGVAIDIIISQMSQLYQLAETGQLPGQVDFPQFATYQEDNESYLDSDRFKQDEAYWQQHARSVPLSFYGWHRRPRSNRVHCVHYQITALEMQRLHERAGQFAGTKQVNHTQLMLLFNTILVVYLHKISQNAEIVIGIPMHNRRTPAFKQTIGSFMQVLPMRVEVEPNDTFITLYRKVKQAHQPLLRHGRYALRNPAQNPLYEVTLNYHIASYDEFAGYPVTPDWQRATYSSELLTLNIFDFARSGQPHLEFDLNSEIFGKIECQYVIEHFQLVLAALLNNPEQPITTVSLLTSTARQQLIQWNQTHIDYPQDISIVELFEKQAVNTPDRLAVVFGDDQLSYRMLNQRANQLARELMAFGVKTDTLVGICVERSLEMIIGLLGILKAGGAYVPLDPNYPQERLSYMLDDSKVSLLLTQSRLQDKLPTTEALIVYLDAPSVFEKQPSDNPNSVYGLENLAYVIYTSGSTGKPKGVMITHQSLSHFVQAGSEKLYNISADDKVLQFASFTFDASVEEIYLALTKGATLILRSPDMLDTNEGFLRLCASWQITVLDLPTAFWQQLLHEENLELLWPDTIRLVIIGGEAASQSVTENWMQRLSHRATLINTYGPTEATVVATAFTVDNTYESLPIGKPIPNVQIHILDTNHQPQPVGIPAELCIAGAGLARGYLNRPELTAEKFIEIELFGKKQRVYKTGDLARWLPDGNLEYLGRIDHQVKLRGFRIELGEIESVLTLHEAVVEAVVVLYEQKDNKALAAYITTHNDELSIDNSPFITSLRAWLKDTLPDYMVPTHFTVLDKLPLTPNGKIDRNALPEPDVLQTGEIIAPQSEIEIELAKLWSTLLNIEINSITAHFFDLGGHSLLATRLVSRIRDDLGVNLPLRVLFEYPVLQDLAHYIELQQPIFLNNPLQEDEEEFEL